MAKGWKTQLSGSFITRGTHCVAILHAFHLSSKYHPLIIGGKLIKVLTGPVPAFSSAFQFVCPKQFVGYNPDN